MSHNTKVVLKSGLEIPQLAIGTSAFGGLFAAVSDSEVAQVVESSIEHGINFFDTAPHYGKGSAEKRLGKVIKAYPRESLVISSKVGRLLVKSNGGDDPGWENSDPLVETLNDVDELNKFITNEINSAADKAITKINFSKNNKDQLPKPILDLIKERRAIRGRAKKDEVARKHYNFLSKEINRAITEHTSQKWEDFLKKFGPNCTSSRPFWKRVNKIRNNTSSNRSLPTLNLGGRVFKSSAEKANLFADQLEKIFQGPTGSFDE